MPRIPAPRAPSGPGPVIGGPRPREVSPARVTFGTVQPAATMPALKSPLVDFGNTLTGIGLSVAEHIVTQERAAVQTKLQLSAVRQLGTLENEVDAAGTASAARAMWDEQFPKIIGRLEQEAKNEGLPEFTGDLMLLGERSKISTRSAIAKRAAQEGADDAAALAAAYEERLAGARTQSDYLGMRSELQRALEGVAQTNPLVSPGEADQMLLAAATNGAKRRATALVEGAVNNPEALQAVQASLLDEGQHPDLPLDARADLIGLAANMEEHIIDRDWQQMRRQETLSNEAKEKYQLANMESFIGRLAGDENLGDAELALAVAEGRINPAAFNFISSVRDGMFPEAEAGSTIDLMAYEAAASQADYGDLTGEEAVGLVNSGAISYDQAKSLIDRNVSSRRQGGIMRRDDIQQTRQFLTEVTLGAVGIGPGAVHQIFMDAEPAKKRITSAALLAYDEAIRKANQTLSPEMINPRQIAGRILRDQGFVAPRPPPPPDMAPQFASVAGNLDTKDIRERAIPEMTGILNSGGLSEEDKDEIARNLDLMNGYLNELEQVDMTNGIVEGLLKSLPQEPARPEGFPRTAP